MVKFFSSPDFAQAIGDYDAVKIMDTMCRNGFTTAYIPIGYDEDEE